MAPPQSEEPRRPPRHLSLLRAFTPADFITLANGASGTGCVLACVSYAESRDVGVMRLALLLLPLALVFDVMDGAVARFRRRSSPYGADLDSLADVVSFGVAPAVVGYALGLSGGWDIPFLIYLVVCGIGRLARFNVTAEALTTAAGKVSHFEGTPIPSSLLIVLGLGIAFETGAVHQQMWWGVVKLGPWDFHPLSMLYAVSGSAMVTTTLKIPKP